MSEDSPVHAPIDSFPYRFQLRLPIVSKGVESSELVLERAPTLGDFEDAEDAAYNAAKGRTNQRRFVRVILARIAGTADADLRALHPKDASDLSDLISPFF